MKNHLSIVSLFKPHLIVAVLISSSLPAISVEFEGGRTPLPKNNLPTLGSGLAMSKGYYRGSPMGELSGWTLSLWFEASSDKKGDLLGIVRNENNGEAYRLTYENGSLSFGDPKQKKRPWKLVVKGVMKEQWNHVVISYGQATGPTIYLNAEKMAQGGRGQMGYATQFDHYHFGAAVLGKGKYGDYFDGKIDDFELYNRPFDEEEIRRLNKGESFPGSLIAWNDFENVNHRKLAYFNSGEPDDDYLEAGRKLYLQNCTSCHSKNGTSPPINPLARSFTKNRMENGGDPFSMFKTLTYGFRNMMPSVQLNPTDRYKVIHYLREKIIREKAPELYVKFEQSNTYSMPTSPESNGNEAKRIEELARLGYLRDYGKALISPVVGNAKSNNALTIDLGNETTISYELGTMRTIGAWTGGYLDFSGTLHHRLRAAGLPNARFKKIAGLNQSFWAWNGNSNQEAPNIFPKTVWPSNQVRFNGYYPIGHQIVISYTVRNRNVLEKPSVDLINNKRFIIRNFTIFPGKEKVELIYLTKGEAKIEQNKGQIKSPIAYLKSNDTNVFWKSNSKGDLVLQINPTKNKVSFNISSKIGDSDEDIKKTNFKILDLSIGLQTGGPRRWKNTHTLKGRLATSTFQGYALDSVTVPLKNEYNSWMRTSSLAFFPDGRLAVGTLAGDVWIVSGINESLDKVTWQRFAAGLYEPLGMKVVDGVLTAITRGRIVKLHDYNNDGEADFYEAFFNEDEPDKGWHAYNFDLEVGKDGSFYYGRTGGFSEWSVPGGVVKVSADGRKSTIIGAGLRVPNGIGKLPDGRITLGDNQGTYVPASKISITGVDAFHGAGSWIRHGNKYDPEKIVQPIVYMPQELDSSSGGQLWVEEDKRLGPLSGQYFHTSYGKAATMYVMMDKIGETVQGAVYKLPLKMESGTMRAAVNPLDGMIYYSGLTGWQAGATQEGSIQRLRFTGKEGIYLRAAKARKGRIELTFTSPAVSDLFDQNSTHVSAWNYKWSKGYGSPNFKITEPEVRGFDDLNVTSVKFSPDKTKLTLEIPSIKPCHNLKLDFAVDGANGAKLKGPVYFTIHELPEI